MKASIILAHPFSKSFNHAIYKTVCTKLEKLNIHAYAHSQLVENIVEKACQ